MLPLLQADGTKQGRVMAQEVMLVIPAIANLIREAKAAQIYSTIPLFNDIEPYLNNINSCTNILSKVISLIKKNYIIY